MDNDDAADAEPVAVVSYKYWKDRFGLDRGVVGKPVFINGVQFTIIGVTPEGFDGTLEVGESANLTLPLATESLVARRPPHAAEPWNWWLRIMGRLKSGVGFEQARANLEGVFQRSAREGHEIYLSKNHVDKREEAATPQLTITSGSRGLSFSRNEYSKQLYILLIVVGLVLLIACVNTANLLLARSDARQKEFAVRIA